MNRRARNVLLFIGSTLGSALLILGIVRLTDGDRSGWIAIVGAIFAFALAFTPGKRLRNELRPHEETWKQ
jgi:hypothetical protein